MSEHFRGEQRTPVPIPTNLDKTPGEVVREWRVVRGLQPKDLARLAGPPVSQPYLSQLETGKIRMPGDEHIRRLSEALEISPGHILCRISPSEAEFPRENQP